MQAELLVQQAPGAGDSLALFQRNHECLGVVAVWPRQTSHIQWISAGTTEPIIFGAHITPGQCWAGRQGGDVIHQAAGMGQDSQLHDVLAEGEQVQFSQQVVALR